KENKQRLEEAPFYPSRIKSSFSIPLLRDRKSMAAIEAALPIFSVCSSSFKLPFSSNKVLCKKLRNFTPIPILFPNYPLSPLPLVVNKPSRNNLCFELCSALQEVVLEEEAEQAEGSNPKSKLYLVNLPWSLSATDIKNLLGQCGTVKDIEIIKQKNGKSRGFAFVTMASAEEAQAVIDKFNSYEISGRKIRIELSKRFKKPSPPRLEAPAAGETRHKIYVSNLAWKARSTHLRDLFSENFKPVSARVVFDAPLGRSAGYGFVSFATQEEAEAAISALDGKELMGRPLRLKFSEKNVNEAGIEKEEDLSEGQQEEL
ncbi:28 kDa ribonucleoprotein, chloroplastic-like, partial [Juglans microcarpa x Juglans regia]|uniref:28 kDa ribonucleoprotein, chloroplastic-like n=1 Tax=Juglans microcarpa x Juglans regia TaxID=2249226 RepID=UPI001B7EE6F9